MLDAANQCESEILYLAAVDRISVIEVVCDQNQLLLLVFLCQLLPCILYFQLMDDVFALNGQ